MRLDQIKQAIGIEPYFEDESGVLYNADCLDIMKKMPGKCVDLVLTDPPYGVKMDKGFSGSDGFSGSGKPIERRRYEDDNWDSKTPQRAVFDNILSRSSLALIFGGNFFTDKLPVGTHWIFWDKLNTMPTFGDGELVWTNSKRKSIKKFTREYNGLIGKEETRKHPTQKPVNLIRELIREYSKEGVVFDPFLGSGTTAVACKELNRKWIGIEINEEYCEIAAKRVFNTQKSLF